MSARTKIKKKYEYKPIKKFKSGKDYELLLKNPDEEISLTAKFNFLNKRILYKLYELQSLHESQENKYTKNYVSLIELMSNVHIVTLKASKNGVTLEKVAKLQNIYNMLYPEID
jgi:hypothetical protein